MLLLRTVLLDLGSDRMTSDLLLVVCAVLESAAVGSYYQYLTDCLANQSNVLIQNWRAVQN